MLCSAEIQSQSSKHSVGLNLVDSFADELGIDVGQGVTQGILIRFHAEIISTFKVVAENLKIHLVR